MTSAMPGPALMVARLSRPQLRALYPLMRQAVPHLTLSQWLRYAQSLTSTGARPTRGVLVVHREGTVHPSGAVCYRRARDARHGSALLAEHLVALDLLYPEQVTAALLAGLDCVARDLGCAVIRSVHREGGSGIIADMPGYRREGVTLTRMVPVTTPH